MAYTPNDRARVRAAYIYEQMSIETAAQFCNFKKQTVLRWKHDAAKAGDDWDKLRDAQIIVGKGAHNAAKAGLTSMMILIPSVIERINTTPDLDPLKAAQAIASLSDSLHKMMSASRKLLPETSELVIALGVIEMLIDFLQDKHKKLLPDFVNVLHDFGQIIEKQYGGQS